MSVVKEANDIFIDRNFPFFDTSESRSIEILYFLAYLGDRYDIYEKLKENPH